MADEDKQATDKPVEEAKTEEPRAEEPSDTVAPTADVVTPAGTDQQGRQLYNVKCAKCGKQTQVPFKPSGDRPVYCRDCYMEQRKGGMGEGKEDKDVLRLSTFAKATKWLRSYFGAVQATKVPPLSRWNLITDWKGKGL